MLQIGNYPKGANLSLLNTIYHYPSKQPDGKYSLDAIDLIIKDNDTGEKFLETIEQPEYEYYMIKPEIFVDHNLFFTEMENVTRISTPYTNLLRDIAQRTGNMNFFMDNIHNGNRYNNTRLHLIPRVMGSDQHIEDHYRWKFSDMYQNELPNEIDKAYFDIEADTRTMKGDFVEPGECPINAISLIDSKFRSVDVYILRDHDNPQCKEFEMNSISICKELKEFIISTLGEEKAKKFKVDILNYEFHYYDSEIEMLIDFFNKVNRMKPDFLMAWNMAFDIPYIIQRIKNLGFNPEDIMCHPDFKYKRASYFIDERNFDDFAERGDFATISSYTVYTDQMIHFASRRKGRSAIANFRLDYIGEITCGVRKLDWHSICSQLQDLPQVNFKIFIFYNVIDTIVQYCIENKSNDIGNALNNVLLNNTRMQKVYRQTVYLKNRAFKSFYKNGFIMGNNCNKDTPKSKFPGAWVSDPKLANDYSKIKVMGRSINVFDNLNDFDRIIVA